MVKHDAFRKPGQQRCGRRTLSLSIAILSAVALFWFALGVSALWHHLMFGSRPYRAAAGMVMLLAALAQAILVKRIYQRPLGGRGPRLGPSALFWRWLLVGLVLTYLVGLALGPEPSVRYFFRASLAVWYTLGLIPLCVSPAPLVHWQRLRRNRIAASLGWLLVVAASTFLSAEVGLQAFDQCTGTTVIEALKLEPGSLFGGGKINQQGYWDDEFDSQRRPGFFRVAALGGSIPLGGTNQTNCLVQLERSVPGIEVYNFGVPEIGPAGYSPQLTRDVARFQPDLVLVFLSVGDDILPIASQRLTAEPYDWRSLQTVRLVSPTLTARPKHFSFGVESSPLDYESFLHASTRRLAVCRTPIEPAIHKQWHVTIGYLDGAVKTCKQRGMAVGLVLVPDEFQVCPRLCETVSRRAGCEPTQIDLELPQRRLVGFAQERSLPVLDLLPHFRASNVSPYGRHQRQLSDHGNKLVTDVVGGWLQSRYGGAVMAAK